MSNINWSKVITAQDREAEAAKVAWDALCTERDRRFEETRWLIERHAEELSLGMVTTLTQQQYNELLLYRQALRDLFENTEDPANPEWPNEPDI